MREILFVLFVVLLCMQHGLCVEPSQSTTTTATKASARIHSSVSDYINKATSKIEKKAVPDQKDKMNEIKQGIFEHFFKLACFISVQP